MSISPIQSINSIHSFHEVEKNSSDQKIFDAISANDSVELKELLNAGANVNATVQLNEPMLEVIIEAQLLSSGKSAEEENPIYLILMACVIAGIFEETGVPPLFFAALTNNLEMMTLLIENGADVHFKACYEGAEIFPLALEARDSGKTLEVVELLHQNGVSIEEMLDQEAYSSPLELLQEAQEVDNTEMVTFLENHGYHL